MRIWRRASAALLRGTLLLAGPPVVLLAAAGNPLPHHPPGRGDWQRWATQPVLTPHTAVTAVVWLLWLAWAATAAALAWTALGRAAEAATGIRLPRIRLRPAQALSATLLGATTITAGPTMAAVAHPVAHPPAAATPLPRPDDDHHPTTIPATTLTTPSVLGAPVGPTPITAAPITTALVCSPAEAPPA